MARRSLRPHLNQIRTWVRQGRTDAWVAHQLEVTVQQIEAFKKENDLLPDGESSEAPGVDFDDEIDLRAEDDALIAAELEAEAARKAEAGEDEDEPSDEAGEDGAPKRRRGRRGGRGRARTGAQEGLRLRGHLRPRRRGLRPVAGPGDRRRRHLRRALGGPPPGRGDGRGRPDRHQAGRRWRRRRRPTRTDARRTCARLRGRARP